MAIRQLVLAAGLALASSMALANHCPKDMQAIDAAMAKNPTLSEQEMKDVKAFRAEGETLHKAGKHTESIETLSKAMKILKM